MNILFIGCVESSYILLNELIENDIKICGVITKKMSPFNSDFRDLSVLCNTYDIDYIYFDGVNENNMIEFIKHKSPDIIYCFGWSHLLSKNIIQIPKMGVVGFHPSKLPFNRGRHPIIWALALGLNTTASSFFMIDDKADNGDIVSQEDVKIDFSDDASLLYKKIMHTAKKQLIHLTKSFSENKVIYTKQVPNSGNVWRKRTKKDGQIDFRMSTIGIYNLIRALTKPYIGAHIEYLGHDYKVWKSEVVDHFDHKFKNFEPGKVIRVFSDTSFQVKTGDGVIRIMESEPIDLKEGDYL